MRMIGSVSAPKPILVATDLTPASEPALGRALAQARLTGAQLLVVHVIPDVLRNHPLLPTPGGSEGVAASDLEKRVADLTTEQVRKVLQLSPDEFSVQIEMGDAEDEIVRAAEAHDASMIVVGAKPRKGMEKYLGHVAERVVRYAKMPVLVARPQVEGKNVLVATDFAEEAARALEVGGRMAKNGYNVTLLHVVELPSVALAAASGPLGGVWAPPSQEAITQLVNLGKSTLDGLVKEHGFKAGEQADGNASEKILGRAEALHSDLVILGSRGRTGLSRLLLGSVAESVIRHSHCSVLVMR
jgi:nucleotide-binding universal stress UspA family protein